MAWHGVVWLDVDCWGLLECGVVGCVSLVFVGVWHSVVWCGLVWLHMDCWCLLGYGME